MWRWPGTRWVGAKIFEKQLPPGTTDFRHEEGAPRTGTRPKRKVRAFTLSDDAYSGLKLLARLYNETPDYGYQNSVSELIERIGSFELVISDPQRTEQPTKNDAFEALKQRMLERQAQQEQSK